MKTAVLITASTRGLGYETAKQFLEAGETVIVNGRKKEELDSIFADYENVYRFHKDLTEEDSADSLLTFLSGNGLTVGCIVHNLGGRLDGDSHPVDQQIFDKTMRLNLTASMDINTALIPFMKQNGSGKIIHIGSSAGYTGNAAPCYAVSKGALNTYVKNTARFFAKDNILICGIVPGILDHEGSDWDTKRINQPEKYEQRLKEMPMGRFQKPSDIAPLILSIYRSESMAVTGSVIEATGGM